MSVDVSILVVSYNTREMTLACLRSVFDETHEASFELIVLDNASADGSADAIEREFGERVRLIRSAENLGFARANNVAAEGANGEYLLLLNPDTVVLRGAIDKLAAFARERPRAGIWGGRTVFADGRLNPSSCWRRMSVWSLACRATGLSTLLPNSGLFHSEAYGGWTRDSVRAVDIVSGCFFLITTNLWRELKGFDPAFFMYGEEADLCQRARRLGARPHVTPDAEIVHYGGASETVREDKVARLLRAKALLIRRHMPRGFVGLSLLLLAMWPLSRSLAGRARGGEDARADVWSQVWARRREWLLNGAGS